jgi:hypothetical protein
MCRVGGDPSHAGHGFRERIAASGVGERMSPTARDLGTIPTALVESSVGGHRTITRHDVLRIDSVAIRAKTSESS